LLYLGTPFKLLPLVLDSLINFFLFGSLVRVTVFELIINAIVYLLVVVLFILAVDFSDTGAELDFVLAYN